MTENGNIQTLAEKIALLLQENKEERATDFVPASFEKINQRLDRIESQIAVQKMSAQMPNYRASHPSSEKFASLAELADEIIKNSVTEKPCLFEPHKPCDHCSMCNSRGF